MKYKTSESLLRTMNIDPLAVASQPQISPQLRLMFAALRRNKSTLPRDVISYLQSSSAPEARKVLEQYNSLSTDLRGLVSIEALCVMAEVSTLLLLEIIVSACVRMGATVSTVIGAVSHPKVVEKTVEMALTDSGIEDRTILHRATGFLPAPKGAQTTINLTQNASASAAAAEVRVPSPEDTIRKFNEGRERGALPPSTAVPLPTIIDSPAIIPVPASVPEEENSDG